MKITILDGSALNPGDLSWDVFKKFGDITVYPHTAPDQVVERIADSDAVFLNKIVIDRSVISRCPKLKYIGVLATGYNVINIPDVKNAGITVTNIPAYSTMAVAQHVFAFITYFTNHVALHNESVQNGEWKKASNFCYWKAPLMELDGKTLGIFGYGHIGKQVAKIGTAFGMKVIVCPHRFDSDIPGCVTKEQLWQQSDFITLHAPLNAETKEIINADTIKQMKDGAFIINTARGGLVNEDDIKTALENNKIAGYAADVILEEPMTDSCRLFNVKNAVITPHIAWAPLETRKRCLDIAVENFRNYLSGNITNSIY